MFILTEIRKVIVGFICILCHLLQCLIKIFGLSYHPFLLQLYALTVTTLEMQFRSILRNWHLDFDVVMYIYICTILWYYVSYSVLIIHRLQWNFLSKTFNKIEVNSSYQFLSCISPRRRATSSIPIYIVS